jgi:hypothetical protein
MAGPTTYAAWTTALEQFGKGNDMAIEEMSQGSFVVDAGTAVRFYARVEEAYRSRKKNWLEQFQRSFQVNNFKTEDDLGIALRNGKQNLLPLLRFVSLPPLPEDLRNTLAKDLKDFVGEIKKSMKDKISGISKGREKMLMQLNSFEVFGNEEISPLNEMQTTGNVMASPGRKIIF